MAGLPRIEETISETIDVVDIPNGAAVDLQEVLFETASLSAHGVHVKNVIFRKCLFTRKTITAVKFQGCAFHECQFNGASIQKCEFHQCTFSECCFYKTQVSGTYLDPASFRFSSKWHRKWANVNAWWYQALYRNAKDIHQEHFAMVADRSFQFYRRYEYLFGKKKRPFRFLASLFYDIALGYGYGIWNVSLVTCGLVALFAALMHLRTTPEAAGVIEHIYFAVVSFTTVGYGDVTPIRSTAALVITTAFLFISVVWGSIVTAVIVKRLVK